jgi:hypothetical protein
MLSNCRKPSVSHVLLDPLNIRCLVNNGNTMQIVVTLRSAVFPTTSSNHISLFYSCARARACVCVCVCVVKLKMNSLKQFSPTNEFTKINLSPPHTTVARKFFGISYLLNLYGDLFGIDAMGIFRQPRSPSLNFL